MRVGVIGINHKLADLKLRESFARICQGRFGHGTSTHGDHSLVMLSTCNRTEVYFSSDELAQTHSYLLNIIRAGLQVAPETVDQKLYSYFGHDCFQHLARVASGLDSAIVAETEIQGQVKVAYESAAEYLNLPSELHYLFQKSLKIGKSVRSELLMGRGMPDVEHAILNTGYHVFGDPEEVKVLFVGASDINQKILSFLKNKRLRQITICNRSPERAAQLAKKYALETLTWDSVDRWHTFDWIIFGTKANNHILTKKKLPKEMVGHKLIIDLCVPRNVEPVLGRDSRITLLNIDQLNRMLKVRRARMTHLLTEAEELVSIAAKKQIHLFHQKEEKKEHFLVCA